jgi:hypothetical protein
MTLRTTCTLAVSVVLLAGTTAETQEEEDPTTGLVESVSLTGDTPINENSLERILRIRKIVGTFQFSEEHTELLDEITSIRLRLDFYRRGQLIDVKMAEPGLGGRKPPRCGQFLVQIVDLDHLRLGDSPPGHWRIFVSLMMSESPEGRGVRSGPQQIDIPKAQFDAQPRTARMGGFRQLPDKTAREIPIFFSASGRVMKYASLSEILQENPESDMLVGVLVLR